jgi:beta-1,4-N-acetylglucosaminyltransferase
MDNSPMRRDNKTVLASGMKVCLVCSHGGHLAEAMLIAQGLKERGREVFFITDSDIPVGGDERVYYVRGYENNPLNGISIVCRELAIMLKERPDAVISTGAEVAVPALYMARFLFRRPTVHVECSAQVVNPSRTGRFVYPVVDLFLVQWEGLLRQYGKKAVYRGGFI